MVRSAEEEVNNVRVAEARAEAVAKAKPGMKQEAGEVAAAKMEARIRVEAEAAAAAGGAIMPGVTEAAPACGQAPGQCQLVTSDDAKLSCYP